MKKLLITMVIALVALSLVWGCGQKADNTGKTPPDVKKAEAIDTTSMDSATPDMGVVDSTVVDSAAKEATSH